MMFTNKPQSFEEAEILRAVQPTDVFNRQRMDALEREIDNMDYAGDPTETLNMRYRAPSSPPSRKRIPETYGGTRSRPHTYN